MNAAELYPPDLAKRTVGNLNLQSYLRADSARPMVEKTDTDRSEMDSTRTGLLTQGRSRWKKGEGERKDFNGTGRKED